MPITCDLAVLGAGPAGLAAAAGSCFAKLMTDAATGDLPGARARQAADRLTGARP